MTGNCHLNAAFAAFPLDIRNQGKGNKGVKVKEGILSERRPFGSGGVDGFARLRVPHGTDGRDDGLQARRESLPEKASRCAQHRRNFSAVFSDFKFHATY